MMSVVTTVFNSEVTLREFHLRVTSACQKLSLEDYEIIYVNDSSTDGSLSVLFELQKLDGRIVIVDLSRNFGQHRAIMTGLDHSRGDMVFILDSDLEEDPEWLVKFHRHLIDLQADVVFGAQSVRKGKLFERASGYLFYRIFSSVTGESLHPNSVTARLMTRRYVDALLLHRERELFLAGLWHITGFIQVPYNVTKAYLDSTTYTLGKKIDMALTSVVSFTAKPLVWVFFAGSLVVVASILFGLWVVMSSLVSGFAEHGWASLAISVSFFGGLNLLATGIIGLYLSRVYSESKQRPYVIVKGVHRGV
jgi:putative glycosyltransferase